MNGSEDDLLKAAIAARAVFGNFAGPYSPGTGAMWLQRLVDDRAPVGSGTTVRGGPGALCDAVRAIVEQAGGQRANPGAGLAHHDARTAA